jgi:hypothetical protein
VEVDALAPAAPELPLLAAARGLEPVDVDAVDFADAGLALLDLADAGLALAPAGFAVLARVPVAVFAAAGLAAVLFAEDLAAVDLAADGLAAVRLATAGLAGAGLAAAGFSAAGLVVLVAVVRACGIVHSLFQVLLVGDRRGDPLRAPYNAIPTNMAQSTRKLISSGPGERSVYLGVR